MWLHNKATRCNHASRNAINLDLQQSEWIIPSILSVPKRKLKNKKEKKESDGGGGKTANQFVSAALISAEGGRKRMPAAAGSLFAGTEWNI